MKRNDDVGFWMMNTSAGKRQKNRLDEYIWLEVCQILAFFLSFNFVLKCNIFMEEYILHKWIAQ